MRVLLVSSWDVPCGIAEHSQLLIQAVLQADRTIELIPAAEALDPAWVLHELSHPKCAIDLIHLNHHDGLHSRWTAGHVEEIVTQSLVPVLVTYHDTTQDPSPTSKLAQLALVASSVVVHEPLSVHSGIKAIYWRQGVPAPSVRPAIYDPLPLAFQWRDGEGVIYAEPWKAYPQQPVLGSVGFNFPWKNFDALAKITGEEGWALVLLSHNATDADETRWRSLNSSILVVRKFLPQDVVINYLAGCDATAFMYECANTGTSGAIRQGIAARKPVIALQSCRQFRDLFLLDVDRPVWDRSIIWTRDWAGLRHHLGEIQPHHYYAPTHRLAHQDSWKKVGENYAQLYHMLAARS